MEWAVGQIKEYCESLSDSLGDTFDCRVYINSRLTRTLGRVLSIEKNGVREVTALEISKRFLETSTDESIQDIIKHEWVHYYLIKTTGQAHGHDGLFKKICAQIGCKNDGTTATHIERTVSNDRLYRYIVKCPNCGRVIGYYQRMSKTLQNIGNYQCGYCHKGDLIIEKNWQRLKGKS